MATETQEIDATDQEWEEDDEDPTAVEGIVPYQGGIVPRAQWDLAAVFQAFEGVALWTHDSKPDKPKPTLFYQVQNRGAGLSVRAMRILSAMRGGFDELDLNVREAICFEAVIGVDGKAVVETVPAVEATVRIRDLVAGNVRIGAWIEPLAKLREDKKSYYKVPDPRMIAVAKAKRNAYAEHFAAVSEPLLKAFMQECAERRQFFSGTVPAWASQALPADDEEGKALPSQANQRRARAEAVIGNAGRDEIAARLLPLEATLGTEVRAEFVAWGTETFGTSKIANWPARRMAEIDAWFEEKAEVLGEALDAEEVVGDRERPDPFEDALPTPLAQVPTEADVRALIAQTSKELVSKSYDAAGLKSGKPFDDPDKCRRMWEALTAVRDGAATPDGKEG